MVNYDSTALSFATRYKKHDCCEVEQALLNFIGTDADSALDVGLGDDHLCASMRGERRCRRYGDVKIICIALGGLQ